MQSKSRWVTILIFHFCVVAFLGFVLRSKILFSIPFLDYNRLLDAHYHFAFGGWVTLALTVLFIYEILPGGVATRPAYRWLPAAVMAASWLLVIASPLPANSIGSSLCSTVFIMVTYVLSWVLIADLRKAAISPSVRLLGISALVCLVLSSFGVFTLAYLFATKSLSAFGYRDALYTYLHFQYNGFFTLGVFAVMFNKLENKMTEVAKHKARQFATLIAISTVPSLFLTYLWRDPNDVYRVIAVLGSITLLGSFVLLGRLANALRDVCASIARPVRYMGCLSVASFALKIFLQSFTLFPAIGNAVFGDRPVIIGFLHLVFLGFVTLFLVAWFAHYGFLDMRSRFTGIALFAFTLAVLLNEAVLMSQGLGAMFFRSSNIFPRILWYVSMALFFGALLMLIARIRSSGNEHEA